MLGRKPGVRLVNVTMATQKYLPLSLELFAALPEPVQCVTLEITITGEFM